MKAIGTVLYISDDKATVESKRNSACSSCHSCSAKGACHAELVFGNQTENVSVVAFNKACAKPGDVVELESKSVNAILIMFVTFILPFILTVPVYFIFNSFVSISNILPLLTIAVFVFLFIFCSLTVNAFVKNRITVNIVRIIEESKDNIEGK